MTQKIINSNDAESGTFYYHPKYGVVLCCGTTGDDHIMAFAVRIETGQTKMRYLYDHELTEKENQAW